MSRASGIFKRPDLLYRELEKEERQQALDNQDRDSWAQFDGITRRVITELAAISPSDWNKGQWAAYNKLLIMRQRTMTALPTERPDMQGLSLEDLVKLTQMPMADPSASSPGDQ
jgi:hypothetical protein